MTPISIRKPATTANLINAGRIAYGEAWELQRKLHAGVVAGGPSALVLCEHPPVYTLGSRTKGENPALAREAARLLGAEVFETDRGGDATWHGPGQMVGYPIFRLADFPCGEDLHRFLRLLEQALMDALIAFGLAGERVEGRTGVWVGGRKAAAIGLKCSRWVTMHGFALNVAPDLRFFRAIRPCGYEPDSATSLHELLGHTPPPEQVRVEVLAAMEARFACRFAPAHD